MNKNSCNKNIPYTFWIVINKYIRVYIYTYTFTYIKGDFKILNVCPQFWWSLYFIYNININNFKEIAQFTCCKATTHKFLNLRKFFEQQFFTTSYRDISNQHIHLFIIEIVCRWSVVLFKKQCVSTSNELQGHFLNLQEWWPTCKQFKKIAVLWAFATKW